MYNPVSTYRLQLHKDFTLEHLDRILPYLQKLGITTVYASPVFASVPGSIHGYDGVNPHSINPEIGTDEQLRNISARLKENNMGWLQDIVPNHMGFHPDNSWLMDVLEKGRQSFYAPFFDVILNYDKDDGRIMVPFLGTSLDEVIQSGDLKIGYEYGRLVLKNYENSYPLNPQSYATILRLCGEKSSAGFNELMAMVTQIEEVPAENWDKFRRQLVAYMNTKENRPYVEECIEKANRSPKLLKQIAGQQVYELRHWQETDEEINYRRFFTVNSLICLNMQNPRVFEHFHKYIKALVYEGVFQGLRIDHIDGLFNPTGYLGQLREVAGPETYITVEKILQPGEELPKYWPVQGNTGYDFLGMVNNVFTNKKAENEFTYIYQQLANDETAIHQKLRDKKAHILNEYMGGELENLYRLFKELNLADTSPVSKKDLKKAIGEFLIQCPVYRYYGNRFPLDRNEQVALQDIFSRIKDTDNNLVPAIEMLENTLLKKPLENDEVYNKKALRFYQRCMQFSGPLMAKGVEDTLMYTYNRFIGHNDVGDSPETFGYTPGEFHEIMEGRQMRWPLSQNATSTHDTKRGEDVRARLNVLTDIPGEWIETLRQWMEMNAGLKQDDFPTANDEYFIYQTLAGAYPMPGTGDDNFGDRLKEYLQKALREAKANSNWAKPNEAYENATVAFAGQLLDKSRPFWSSFEKFHSKIADFGIINSLSQLVLKFTCPGVPDVYQGTELWDLSLVDPDNRRPVDYEQRMEFLDELAAKNAKPGELLKALWHHRNSGRIKLWLTHHLLNERKQHTELFTEGHYIPLQIEGYYKNNVLAFARRTMHTWYVVAVPLHPAAISDTANDFLEIDWRDTRIALPDEMPVEWQHQILKTKGNTGNAIYVHEIFKHFPLALLKMEHPANLRAAGVLLHITSLPSHFGVGDFGPSAWAFANFLSRSCQKYWQLLPLNPTEGFNAHSPYSSYSAMAGNPLLISPEILADEGLLDADELKKNHLPSTGKADFDEAKKLKYRWFDEAYHNYLHGDFVEMRIAFKAYCESEKEWLDDFALYVVLKQQHNKAAWFQWPQEYKTRDAQALEKFAAENDGELQKVKWLQFVFYKQWKQLKNYCNNIGIKLFGDMPIYISYDSTDVWAHPGLFMLDEQMNVRGMAGVPPDYFSETGQLWGMPTFRWDVMKERKYDWWIYRLRRNLAFFDLVRIDHFRAFADYWEVPAGEETAVNGKWIPGPRADFFSAIEKELGALPIVAEDLGYEMDVVYKLRDEVKLPGMKVLQFAFGDNLPKSVDIPHNYTSNCVVYTGTHDNNTTLGWFKAELKNEDRQRLEEYLGYSVHNGDIHYVLAKMAYSSVAQIAILPVQDILGLDADFRMNTPGTTHNNWLWRLSQGQLTEEHERLLRHWTKFYNRL